MADSFFHDKTEHLPATYLGKNSQSISPPIVREKKTRSMYFTGSALLSFIGYA
ncbi:hypothetical protein DESPIG_02290 [Desulfovibrio piger ATCC 29098]|uniref:Uncharacterized protein n=1 Tax=Desulfovibrio piger ATCC 29098 TaxID=411464 RepID=B6WW21_9BACT|nr:hypothetical protein DESPIG_02290 [Desulfovibrio piger ATCC 29098]